MRCLPFQKDDYKFSVDDAPVCAEDTGKSNLNEMKRIGHKHKRHSNVTHANEKRHACDQCDKSFPYRSILLKHKKTNCIRKRSHACKECGKCFIARSKLKIHLVTHTGQKPFACDQCDKSFGHSGSLSNHKKMVHEQIRSHACEECGKCFALVADLKKHSYIHTGTC